MKPFFNLSKFLPLLIGLLLLSCSSKPGQVDAAQAPVLDSGVTAPPTQLVMSNQSTVKVERNTSQGIISVSGYVSPDPERTAKVAARFSGRIEKLYFNYNYQYVKKGTKIMDVYSPELNTYQDEYLYLLKSSNDQLLLSNARKKLRLLGMTDNQINYLEKKGKRSTVLSVIAPVTGYLLFEEETQPPRSINNPSPMAGGNMSGIEPLEEQKPAMSPQEERIREGSYITEGQTLFSVNDLREVWGILLMDSQYGPLIRTGLPVIVRSELSPNEAIHTRINFVEPEFAAGQKFIRIRVSLPNSQVSLKTNSLLTGRIFLNGSRRIRVPSSSIYDLGTRKIVWVYTGKKDGTHKVFEAKEVTTGITSNGFTEIISGLPASAEIAKDAGYLMDSESLLPVNQ